MRRVRDRPARKISKSKKEPGGQNVKPGNYKVKVHYGELSDETPVNVKTDPRLNPSLASINEVYETAKKLQGHVQKGRRCGKTAR